MRFSDSENSGTNAVEEESLLVWVVEDHEVYREELCGALTRFRSRSITAEGFRGAHELLDRIRSCRQVPDVVLLDIRLPGISGIELIGEIKRWESAVKVIMLTNQDNAELIDQSLRSGADGYLLKTASLPYIIESVHLAQSGGLALDPKVTLWLMQKGEISMPCREAAASSLSSREQDVVNLLAEGRLKKEIADQLGVSFHTVDTHLRRIYEKLGVANKNAAVAEAMRQGLIGRSREPGLVN